MNNSDPQPLTAECLMGESGHLYGYAVLRVCDHHHAEDLVQDCILTAWQQRDSFDGKSSLRTWMIGILKHKVFDYHRKTVRTPSHPNGNQVSEEEGKGDMLEKLFDAHGSWKIDPSVGMSFLDESPERALLRSEVMDFISRCIARLPVKLRVLFTAREFDQMPVPEAALLAGATAGSAAVLLTRARHQLRDCLQRSYLQEP
jgi:RNA polymerase sigma-70 factor (ECF subfamily)